MDQGSTHTYKAPEGTTTEWDVLQRKFGNLPPMEPVWKPAAYAPPGGEEDPALRPSAEARPADQARVDRATDAEGLDELEDEYDDDRFMAEYRRKRMAELAAAKRPRFGSVEPLSANEFVQKVGGLCS